MENPDMDATTTAPAPVAATGTPDASPLAGFDLWTAWQEGWTLTFLGVLTDGRHRIELARVSTTPSGTTGFDRDQDAWDHVVTQARAGSALHRDALARVDRMERMLIEASCGTW